jgi:hypothetical protein
MSGLVEKHSCLHSVYYPITKIFFSYAPYKRKEHFDLICTFISCGESPMPLVSSEPGTSCHAISFSEPPMPLIPPEPETACRVVIFLERPFSGTSHPGMFFGTSRFSMHIVPSSLSKSLIFQYVSVRYFLQNASFLHACRSIMSCRTSLPLNASFDE